MKIEIETEYDDLGKHYLSQQIPSYIHFRSRSPRRIDKKRSDEKEYQHSPKEKKHKEKKEKKRDHKKSKKHKKHKHHDKEKSSVELYLSDDGEDKVQNAIEEMRKRRNAILEKFTEE